MARPSRPPGFDMTYRPPASAYGPPWPARIPSFLYLGAAIGVAAVVALAQSADPSSWLHYYVVQRDPDRIVGARMLAVFVMVSALAAVLRASLRGVRIVPEGVLCREVLALGFPKVRRFRWAQIDRIILDQPNSIAFDLWDGSRAFLPTVGDRAGLAAALEKVAAARSIPVRGGAGLDDLPDAEDLEDD